MTFLPLYIMSYEYIAPIVFYGLVLVFLYIYRDKFDIQKIGKLPIAGMMRTQFGIKLMDSVSSKHNKFVRYLGYVGIPVGFLFMILIVFLLLWMGIPSLFQGGPAVVSPVLPGVKIPGSTFFIPLISGWIALFFVVTIHEFGHGVVARAFKLKVLNSGLAFFGPLLAAFVEPDEKKLKKAKASTQLAVFAAGPWFNIITAFFITLLLMFVAIPLSFHMFPVNGITITSLNTDLNPFISNSDLQEGDIIHTFNGVEVIEIYNLSSALSNLTPGDAIVVGTDRGNVPINLGEHPLNASVPVIGINLEARIVPRYQSPTMKPVNELMKFVLGVPSKALGVNNDRFTWREYFFIAMSPLKLAGILTLINVFSLGLGTANLIPAWIFDGGRMMGIVTKRVTKKEKIAREIMHWISLFFIVFLLALLFVPMIRAFLL